MGLVHSRTFLRERQEIVDRLSKWQELVNLVAKIFGGSTSLVCQITESGIRPVVASDQESNPFPIGTTFPFEAHTFCKEVIVKQEPLYIPDAAKDPYWEESPVWTEHGFRSYYGVPLFWPDGQAFGTICIMDMVSTEYEEPFIQWLTCFRDLIEADLISAAQYLNKSDFLAGVSHELRTPMNGIVGMAESLLRSSLSTDQKLEVETIRDCAETLVSLLNDIQDITKIEAGHLEIDIQNFSLREMIAHTERLWRTRSDAKYLALAVEVEPDIPDNLEGDVNRIKQVLFNLLSNAIKYTDQGGVTVRIRSKGQEDGSDRVRFEVQDTGDGLDIETQQRLFQQFIQPSPSIGRAEGGAGLGLAISRNLVEMMGGAMGVDSELGIGSTFYVELPLGVSRATDVDSMGSKGIEIFRSATDVSVLIVEDNRINQRVLEAYLAPFQYRSTVAVNGAEAVEIVQNEKFDIILMDIQMPVMDGIDATRNIREQGGWRGEVPIVAITANAMVGDRERYLEAGMDDYVPKPVNREALTQVFEKYKLPSGNAD
jgi:signal transduction histidine kinase/CheY-like chemotaxis protein